MNSKKTAYLLWLTFFLGLGGVHRLYNGKIGTGLLWLCTGGLFGVGQFIDLLLIPEMVDDHNLRKSLKYGLLYDPAQPAITSTFQPKVQPPLAINKPLEPAAQKLTDVQLRLLLLKAAEARGGKISVTQGVLDTGADFEEVEAALASMAKKGYVGIENHPNTGVVVYDFHELSKKA